jgi:lipopolysaccharide transport system ATP-binding protein
VVDYAIECQGLGKAYRLYGSPLRRIGEALSFGAWRGHHEFWALREVDFALRRGGALGLCGANGAGKSTLLKLLAGTTRPSAGRFRIGGRVASLLELGAGFHLDFTGRANIMINGIMMGYSRREMQAKIPEIIEFAELGAHIDEPVRTYSSGMGLRLGFSVAVAVDPDVLIIDEVFAVGDMYFQKKCVDRIYEFRRRNKTIVFCSHSLYDVRQLCDEALWLREGRVAGNGSAVAVTNDYSAFQVAHIDEHRKATSVSFPGELVATPADAGAAGRGPLPRVLDARVYRLGTDEEVREVSSGDSIEVRVWWENPAPERTPIHVGMAFVRQDMTTCYGTGTHFDGVALAGARGCTVLELPRLALLSGQFLLPVFLFDGAGVHKYQEHVVTEPLVVRSPTRDIGLMRLEHAWHAHRAHALPAARPAASPAAVGASTAGGAA